MATDPNCLMFLEMLKGAESGPKLLAETKRMMQETATLAGVETLLLRH
jgi:hypothetical protein